MLASHFIVNFGLKAFEFRLRKCVWKSTKRLLSQTKHCFNVVQICLVYKSSMSQVTFLLFCLFSQNVAFKSMFSFDLSCSGKGEPFFCTGVSFHFWHCYYIYFSCNIRIE